MGGDRPKAFWAKKLKMLMEKREGHHSATEERLRSPAQAEGAGVAWHSATATQVSFLTGPSQQAKSRMLGNAHH